MVCLRQIALEGRRLDLVDGEDGEDERVAAERVVVGADDRAALALDALRQVAHRRAVDEALPRLEPRRAGLRLARRAPCGRARARPLRRLLRGHGPLNSMARCGVDEALRSCCVVLVACGGRPARRPPPQPLRRRVAAVRLRRPLRRSRSPRPAPVPPARTAHARGARGAGCIARPSSSTRTTTSPPPSSRTASTSARPTGQTATDLPRMRAGGVDRRVLLHLRRRPLLRAPVVARRRRRAPRARHDRRHLPADRASPAGPRAGDERRGHPPGEARRQDRGPHGDRGRLRHRGLALRAARLLSPRRPLHDAHPLDERRLGRLVGRRGRRRPSRGTTGCRLSARRSCARCSASGCSSTSRT